MGKLKETIELLKNAQELKELTELIIPEVYPYLERITDSIVDLKVRAIRRYEDEGFSREDAILMTLDTQHSLMNNARNN